MESLKYFKCIKKQIDLKRLTKVIFCIKMNLIIEEAKIWDGKPWSYVKREILMNK